MATTQEMIKARELMKTSGLNLKDAVAQARTLTTTPLTPVAGVAPAPTAPVTPTPVTPAPIAPATPQVTGVDGQKFTQAPVDPATGLSKPIEPISQVTPEPVKIEVAGKATPKTTPVKTDIPVDYTQARGREQEITTNLESFKAQGMSPEQILKASDYANASPEKKAMIEPYLKQTQPTTDSMFNSIVAKADIPDAQKVLPSYKIAQNRYLKANMYASMTPSQVTQEMNASRLIEGSRTWEDLKTLNPKLAQDAQNLRIVNGSKSNIFTYVNNPDGTPVKDENGEDVKENNLVKTFTQDYLDDYGDFLREIYRPETMEEINAKIYTPDAKMAQDKADEIELELNAIEKDINSIEADIDKELAGTGATGSRARLEKALRADKLQNLYNSTLKNYETYANKANNLINQNTATYQEAYRQNQALQSALASAGGVKFQSELALATKQAEFDQKLAQQVQLASDPTTATNQIIDTFAEMGIMADRSRQEIIADVQNKVANGIPLGQALTELQTAFKSKPLYKSMVDAQMRELAPATTGSTQDWTKLDDTTLYNQKTGETKKVSASVANSYPASFSGDTTAYIASKEGFRDTAYQDSAGVWTIGYGTTRINGKPIQPGQTITQVEAQKLLQEDIAKHSNWKNFIDENTLSPNQRTALASFEYNLGPGIWNKSAMNIIDMIKSGDLEGAGREIQKYNQADGKVIKGLQNRRAEEAQLLMNTGTGTTGTQYTDSDIELFADIAAMDGSVQNTALKNSGITRQQLADYKAAAVSGKIPPTEGQRQAALGILSNIQGISQTDWTDATGKFDYSRIMGLQDATNAGVLIENLRDAAAFNNLGMIKGPMSDKDISFLKSVSSKLDPLQGNKQFEKNIVEMYNIAAKKAGVKEITKLSEIPKERILPGEQTAQQDVPPEVESEINAFDAWQANQ